MQLFSEVYVLQNIWCFLKDKFMDQYGFLCFPMKHWAIVKYYHHKLQSWFNISAI